MLKIVDFSEYCYKCEHNDNREENSPCHECLSIPAREDSRRPEKYVYNGKEK